MLSGQQARAVRHPGKWGAVRALIPLVCARDADFDPPISGLTPTRKVYARVEAGIWAPAP